MSEQREKVKQVEKFLLETSRTFALTIPLLPQPLRHQVGVGYLLFRILDTLEDGNLWPCSQRQEAIREFSALLHSQAEAEIQAVLEGWLEQPPVTHAGYLRLLAGTHRVLAELREFPLAAQEVIVQHLERTATEMSNFLNAMDEEGQLVLAGLEALRQYCYAVAGIVGEMLTELFVEADPGLQSVRQRLAELAPLFGEGLQLINVLKDAPADSLEGRQYLPQGVPRSAVVDLAREDLQAAGQYVRLLEESGKSTGNQGVVGFCALPVILASANLDLLESGPPDAKLGRVQVIRLASALRSRLQAGEPAIPSLVPMSRNR